MIYSKLLIAATLVGSANAACIRSTQAGYVTIVDPILLSFYPWDPTGYIATCAAGYSGTAVEPTVCTSDGGEYVLSGCTPCSAGKFNSAAGNGVTCTDWTAVGVGGTTTCTANKLDTTARWAGTTTADATCAACAGTTDFGPADGSTDCVAASALASCTANQADGSARKVAATATADAVCDACDAGTFGPADGSTICVAWTAVAAGSTTTCTSTQVGGTPNLWAGTATTDAVCNPCAAGSFGPADGSTICVTATVCGDKVNGCAGSRATTVATATNDAVCGVCDAGAFGKILLFSIFFKFKFKLQKKILIICLSSFVS